HPSASLVGLAAKVNRISQILESSVVVQLGWLSRAERMRAQQIGLLLGDVTGERTVTEKLGESARGMGTRRRRRLLDHGEGSNRVGRELASESDFEPQIVEVDVPGLDQWVEKGGAAVVRNVVDLGIEELEHQHPHLLERASS